MKKMNIGFDLVGHEDNGITLKEYLPILLKFQDVQMEEYGEIVIPFIFHAGETLKDGDEIDDNLYDAILLNTKRIGHGYSLYKHPELMKMCKDRNIPIEVCPISNEILRLTSGIGNHPIACLMNYGVQCCLSSDDPAIFNNSMLSYDFYTLINYSQNTNMKTLKKLALNSLEYSRLPDDLKQGVIEQWNEQWNDYMNWILNEFGDASK